MSSRSTSRPASTTRSTAWAGTTTRTRRDPRVWQPGRLLGRRHVHERSSHGRVPRGRGAGAVAALLLHRTEHGRSAGRRGRPVGLRLRHAGREELLRRDPRVGNGRHRPFHPGAEGHRHRPQPGWLGAEGRRQGLPAAADERQLADRPSLRDSAGHRRPPVGARVLERHQQRVPVRPRRGHRIRQAARHGKRRLHRRFGQGPAPRLRPWTRRTSGPRTAASGRWCSIRTTRRR